MPHPKINKLKLNRFSFALMAAKYARATWPAQTSVPVPSTGATHIARKIDEALAIVEKAR